MQKDLPESMQGHSFLLQRNGLVLILQLGDFQEDNDPKHTSRLAKNWKDEHDLQVMDWPIPKANVAQHKPRNLKGLKKVIKEEWMKLTKEFALHLIESMKTRISSVINVEGDSIMY